MVGVIEKGLAIRDGCIVMIMVMIMIVMLFQTGMVMRVNMFHGNMGRNAQRNPERQQ